MFGGFLECDLKYDVYEEQRAGIVLKIFVVIQCSNLGGMEKSALETIVELQRDGHEVSMFSMQPVGDLKK